MSDLLNRLADMANMGKKKFNGPNIPVVKLDGSAAGPTAGHILQFENGDMIDLGSNVTIQIIKVRKKLWAQGDTFKMYSNEYDSFSEDEITLRRADRAGEAWGDGIVLMSGKVADIRGQHDVKVVSVVYGIVNDKLVKLTVKGASTVGDDGLYAYLDSFKGNYPFQFKTKITTSLVQKNRTVSYYRMHFARGAEVKDNYEVVEQYLEMINGNPPKVVSTGIVVEPEKTVDDFF